jgi:hypothetical protein
MTGPDGQVTLVATDIDDALEMSRNLISASNGYHSVQIEKDIE